MKKTFKLLFFCIVIIALYFTFERHPDAWNALGNVSTNMFCLLLFFSLLTLVILAYGQNKIFNIIGLNQNAVEWLGLSFIASFYNLIVPFKGGSIMRSVYLKNKYVLPYSSFLMYLIKQALYMFTASLIMLASAIQLVNLDLGLVSSLVLSVSIVTVVIFLYSFEGKLLRLLGNIKKIKINVFFTGFSAIIFSSFLFFIILRAITLYLSFEAIHYPVLFFECLLIAPLLNISNLISILPGNLGVKEFLMGGGFILLGHDYSYAVLASLVDRGALMMMVTIVAIFFKYLLYKIENNTQY